MANFKDTWLLTTHEGFKLIRSNIEKIVDELELDPTLDGVAEALGFVFTPVTRPDGKITTLKWVLDLEEIGELDELPLLEDEEGPEKGYELKRFWGKNAISKAASKWLDKARMDSTIPAEVKDEIAKLTNKVSRLSARAKKARNFLATQLLVKGFSITSDFGPGSPTPYGQPLFSAVQPIGTTSTTQSNLMTGGAAVLSQTNLEAAIDRIRNMRDGNGTVIWLASSYTLVVGYQQEKLARKILNDGSNFAAASLDVQVNNSVTMSVFQWDGFKINLLVLTTLGQPSVSGTVGTGTEWFLLNHELASEMEAFRLIPLYEAEIDSYKDSNNKVTYIDVDMSFTVDHYNPEVIVGSLWV